MTDFQAFRPTPGRIDTVLRFTLLAALSSMMAMMEVPRAAQAQPEQVADRFTSTVAPPHRPNEEVITTFSTGSTNRLCFTWKDTVFDDDELFCYDGSTLRQVTNIGGPSTPSDPRDFEVYDDGSGPKLYFRATSEAAGTELFVYDGSTVQLAADIVSGSGDSRPANLTVYNDGTDAKLYYRANDGSDAELHAYDGTSDQEVADINPNGSSSPLELTVYGGRLYYHAFDGDDGELHAYDGTASTEVADIDETDDSNPADLTVYDPGSGAKLYYSADEGGDRELHAFDGSSDSEVADINTSGDSDPRALAVYGSELYYGASDGDDRELHAYDGSSDSEVADINTGSSSSSDPEHLTVYNGELYYSAVIGFSGRELHKYDGSSDQKVAAANSSGASPSDLIVYNDGSGATLYFLAFDGSRTALRQFDGSAVTSFATTNNLGSVAAIDNSINPVGISPSVDKTAYNNALYFQATNGSDGAEIWSFDGSSINLVKDLNSSRGSKPREFTVYNGNLYFTADSTSIESNDRELWTYDGSSFQRIDVNTSGSSDPKYLTVYNDGSGAKLYYQAYDGSDTELHAYDGASDSEVADINGSGHSNPKYLTVYDDGSGAKLYYQAYDGSDRELRAYDGSSDQEVADINGGIFDSSFPEFLYGHDGVLYFRADGGDGGGEELWAYDGSGASRAADINASGDSDLRNLTSYNGDLYYTATDGSDRELHVFDGSSDSEVADVAPSGSSDPQDLVAFGGRLYFTAANGTDGREPHAYDGSSVTSVDLHPGAPSGGGTAPARFGDGGSSGTDLYVTATDGTYGLELHRFTTNSAPLPVELPTFDGTQTGDAAVELTWTTASETNNAGFEVQHRRVTDTAPFGAWDKIGFVDGHGTTTQAQSYRFEAEALSVGTHQFRLKQVDLDGSTTIHGPVTVELQMKEPLRLAAPAPNPVSGQATLSFAVKESQTATLRLYDALGQEVATVYEGTPTAGESQAVQFEATDLASGMYFLRLRAGSHVRTQRLTVVR